MIDCWDWPGKFTLFTSPGSKLYIHFVRLYFIAGDSFTWSFKKAGPTSKTASFLLNFNFLKVYQIYNAHSHCHQQLVSDQSGKNLSALEQTTPFHMTTWVLISLQGPLTTTFTAPLSCSTLHNNVIIGHNVTDSDTHTTFFEPEGALCGIGTSVRSCLPSGSLLDSEYNSYTKNPDPRYGWTINYFSPGLICPSDWETVGVATKSVGGSITSSGPAFVYPSVIPTAGIYYEDLRDPSPNALLEAMSEGESAILCCPRYAGAKKERQDDSCSAKSHDIIPLLI